MEISKLLELAQSLLSSDSDIDQRLSLVEEYVQAFDSWHKGLAEKEFSKAEELQLQQLNEQHTQVLDLVHELQTTSVEEVKGFHKRAKGIMAYTDRLPRRVSIAAKRKG